MNFNKAKIRYVWYIALIKVDRIIARVGGIIRTSEVRCFSAILLLMTDKNTLPG